MTGDEPPQVRAGDSEPRPVADAKAPPVPIDAPAADALPSARLSQIPHYVRVLRHYLGARVHVLFALMALEAVLEGFGLLLLLPLLEHLLAAPGEGGAGTAMVTWVRRVTGIDDAEGLLWLMVVVFCIKGAIGFLGAAYNARLQVELQKDLLGRLYDAQLSMRYRYYADRNTGHFYNLFSQTFGFVGAAQSLASLLVGCLRAAVYLGLALLVSPVFGLAAIAVGAVLFWLFRGVHDRVLDLAQRSAAHMGELSQRFVQSIQSFKYLVATDSAAPLRAAALASMTRAGELDLRQGLWMAFTQSLREPVAVLLIVVVFVLHLRSDAGGLASVMVSILLFYRGVNTVLGVQGSWQETLSSIGVVGWLHGEFQQLEAERERTGGEPAPALTEGIEFVDVVYAYDARKGRVLDGVSFAVPARTTVALVGPSGAGKSTIVDLLTLMLEPVAGEIRIDGIPATRIEPRSWRRQIGYVLQEPVVFDDSIAANICLWSGDERKDPALAARIRHAARQACLADFIDSLPDGYQTRVGDRGIQLSGGQRQRLFIARELFKQPRLLILDEATSALDSEAEQAIQQSIEALHGQITVVIVAHRLATVRRADRVLVFEHGRLVEQGSPAELLSDSASRFAEMVRRQAF